MSFFDIYSVLISFVSLALTILSFILTVQIRKQLKANVDMQQFYRDKQKYLETLSFVEHCLFVTEVGYAAVYHLASDAQSVAIKVRHYSFWSKADLVEIEDFIRYSDTTIRRAKEHDSPNSTEKEVGFVLKFSPEYRRHLSNFIAIISKESTVI